MTISQFKADPHWNLWRRMKPMNTAPGRYGSLPGRLHAINARGLDSSFRSSLFFQR